MSGKQAYLTCGNYVKMNYTFYNSVHGTSARLTARNWTISQNQVRRLWQELCGQLDCGCGLGGVQGKNKWRLKKGLFCEGAEIHEQ